jgi:hypothetical protein
VPDGLAQRAIDVLVFGWFVATSLKLLRLDRRVSHGEMKEFA